MGTVLHPAPARLQDRVSTQWPGGAKRVRALVVAAAWLVAFIVVVGAVAARCVRAIATQFGCCTIRHACCCAPHLVHLYITKRLEACCLRQVGCRLKSICTTICTVGAAQSSGGGQHIAREVDLRLVY